jgi:predicted dinucleotide-binding enzyme
MKAGVLGSGLVGRTLAEGFLKHGHEVMLGTRDPGAADIQAWRAKRPGPRLAPSPRLRGSAISSCSPSLAASPKK